MKYGQGLYKILKKGGFWFVGRFDGSDEDGTPIYRQISNLYCYKGWAENYARRFRLTIS